MAIQPTEAPNNTETQKPDYTTQQSGDEQAFEEAVNAAYESMFGLYMMGYGRDMLQDILKEG
ncbi:hypothetical protein [Litchfieldella rifensis]|uniref:Uncharacterized protein n=1 Tax=Litchfieldella rifensis TaxID=762643 RepID=A0ABV7LIP2_9GAMM